MKASSIWYQSAPDLETLNALGKNNMVAWLGIEFTEMGDDYLSATMPVDHRTIQPYGLLHGGASVVLAETLGSMASHFVVDSTCQLCVGVEVNANHLRSARSGMVTGTCRPINLGRTIHVWQIEIRDEMGRLTCVSRLTVAVLEKKN
jgi:1,4-dihydroxy-2-naphthoyl-CoA hydrolase